MEATLKHVPENQIDVALGPENTVAETRKRYEQYKGNFKAPHSWDIDIVSMVQKVGEPVFPLAYTNPNFKIHATLASAAEHDDEREVHDAETARAVMRSQNTLFSLNLDSDIDARTAELRDAQAQAV